MADTVARMDHYSVVVANQVGEGARVLEALRKEGVNLIGFWGYPIGEGSSQLELATTNVEGLKKAVKAAKLKLSKKQTAFHVTGKDRPGALGAVMTKLAQAGINVHAVQAAVAAAGKFGAFIYVAPEDVRKASKALGV